MAIPTPGNFAALPGMGNFEAEMLTDAYQAVAATESWEHFRNFSEESFMFSRAPWLSEVQGAMKLMDQHSGASYGWVMRVMERIAKHGWAAYAQPWTRRT